MANEIIEIHQSEYNEILRRCVAVINSARKMLAQQVASIASNTYWEIGKLLHERKLDSKYGSNIVKRLSVDLKEQFPDMGTSPRQLWNMKAFYERYKDSDEKVLRSVAVLPWKHNLLLMSKNLDDAAVVFYAEEDIAKGWNHDLLLNAIKMEMHKSAAAIPIGNNFANTLPAVQAEYANEVFRSTYNLGFLGVTQPILELELERRLVDKVKQFLLELGKGFTYIGNQWELEYNGKTSRVDLLLYHRGLRSLIAIDLKIGAFKPEYAGKMNYYLSLLDRLERQPDENRSIGIILCAEKDRVEVEIALEDMGKPIGVADYQLIIPKDDLQKVITDEMKQFDMNNRMEEDEV